MEVKSNLYACKVHLKAVWSFKRSEGRTRGREIGYEARNEKDPGIGPFQDLWGWRRERFKRYLEAKMRKLCLKV